MATIRLDSRLTERIINSLDSSLKQHKIWIYYSIFAPLIAGFAGVLFYLASVSTAKNLVYLYIAGAAMSSACWWLWTMFVVYKLFVAQKHVVELTSEVLSELKEIKTSVLENKTLTSVK